MGRISVALFLCGLYGCAPTREPVAIRLVDVFDSSHVEGTSTPVSTPGPTEFRFDGEGSLPTPEEHVGTYGFWAIHGVSGLRVEEGLLVGTSSERPILAARVNAELDPDDLLHAVEVRMRASDRSTLGVSFASEDRMSEEAIISTTRTHTTLSALNVTLDPGDDVRTFHRPAKTKRCCSEGPSRGQGSGKRSQSISRGSRDARSRSSSAFLPSRKAPSDTGARRSYATAAGSRSTEKARPRATRFSGLLRRSPRESFSSSRIRSVEISSFPMVTSARTRPCSRSSRSRVFSSKTRSHRARGPKSRSRRS